jgi:hypothetical protein
MAIGSGRVSTVEQLPRDPPNEIHRRRDQKSACTRRVYLLDVQHFMCTPAITTSQELRQADYKVVIAWERHMREIEHAAASAIRRQLASERPQAKVCSSVSQRQTRGSIFGVRAMSSHSLTTLARTPDRCGIEDEDELHFKSS